MDTTNLTLEAAKALVATLYRTGRVKITTRIEFDTQYDTDPKSILNAKVVFSGGKAGEHSIWLSVSSQERIVAHFEGYCEANGMLKPEVGQKVDFPSASNWRSGGYRTGTVLKVGPKRVVVSYKFKHGGETTATIRIADLKFSPCFPKPAPFIQTRFEREATI